MSMFSMFFLLLRLTEVLVGLMFIEQTRPEEWIKISGILTSRIVLPPLTEKNQQQICLLDRAQGMSNLKYSKKPSE